MGTNKRYPEGPANSYALRQLINAAHDHQPETLLGEELDLHTMPLTRPPRPRPVLAWVHYGKVAVRVDAWAVAWTENAVAIKWQVTEGREDKAWVWWPATIPRAPRQQPSLRLGDGATR